MKLRVVGLAALALGVSAFAGDAEWAKLMGAWESQGGTDNAARATWLLEPKGGAVHVTYLQGSQKLAEFECDTSGRECAGKAEGHSAKISLYFNGPTLVELETKGPEVIKRRFAVAGTGEEMDVELIPVVSKSKAETVHFKRAKLAASPK
jgi:hypothetical protein